MYSIVFYGHFDGSENEFVLVVGCLRFGRNRFLVSFFLSVSPCKTFFFFAFFFRYFFV